METLRDAENQIDKIHSISAIETVNISYLIYRKGNLYNQKYFYNKTHRIIFANI